MRVKRRHARRRVARTTKGGCRGHAAGLENAGMPRAEETEERAHEAENEERIGAGVLADGNMLRRCGHQQGSAGGGELTREPPRDQPNQRNGENPGSHGKAAYLFGASACMRDEPRKGIEKRRVGLQHAGPPQRSAQGSRREICSRRFVVLKLAAQHMETSEEQSAKNCRKQHAGWRGRRMAAGFGILKCHRLTMRELPRGRGAEGVAAGGRFAALRSLHRARGILGLDARGSSALEFAAFEPGNDFPLAQFRYAPPGPAVINPVRLAELEVDLAFGIADVQQAAAAASIGPLPAIVPGIAGAGDAAVSEQSPNRPPM